MFEIFGNVHADLAFALTLLFANSDRKLKLQ